MHERRGLVGAALGQFDAIASDNIGGRVHLGSRLGGAVAREMLIEAAAEAWGVPQKECSAANSVITHGPSGRTTTYGKVAAAAAELERQGNPPASPDGHDGTERQPVETAPPTT